MYCDFRIDRDSNRYLRRKIADICKKNSRRINKKFVTTDTRNWEATVAMAAPTPPYTGISTRLMMTFATAPIKVIANTILPLFSIVRQCPWATPSATGISE